MSMSPAIVGRASRSATARLRECVEVMRALWRGRRSATRALSRWTGPGCGLCRTQPPLLVAGAVSVPRPRLGGAVGRWPAHGQSAARSPAPGHRRLPRCRRPRPSGCRCTCAMRRTRSCAGASPPSSGGATASHVVCRGSWTSPEQFEAATRHVDPETVAENVRISADLDQHAAWLAEYVDLGFEEIYRASRRPGQERLHRCLRREGFAAARRRGSSMSITRTSDLWWKQAVVYCLDVADLLRLRMVTALATSRACPSASTTWSILVSTCHLVDAVLPDRGCRRRLRHHRLLRSRSSPGHVR